MDVIKLSAVVLAGLALAAITLLCALGKISGDTAVNVILALAGGGGITAAILRPSPASSSTSTTQGGWAGLRLLLLLTLAGLLSAAVLGCSTTAAYTRGEAAAQASERTICLGWQLTCDLMNRQSCVEKVKEVCQYTPKLLQVWLEVAKPPASSSPASSSSPAGAPSAPRAPLVCQLAPALERPPGDTPEWRTLLEAVARVGFGPDS